MKFSIAPNGIFHSIQGEGFYAGHAMRLLVAEHSCMSCRGVRQTAKMHTSSMLGLLRDDSTLRAEFFAVASAP